MNTKKKLVTKLNLSITNLIILKLYYFNKFLNNYLKLYYCNNFIKKLLIDLEKYKKK